MLEESSPKEQLKEKIEKLKKDLRGQFYDVITSKDEEWKIIRQLQESGKFPSYIRQVFIYRIPRQYEKNVMNMEHWKILEVELKMIPFSLSHAYREIIHHNTCYNPREGRLHILLQQWESLDKLPYIFQKKTVFTPPIYL